MEVIRPYTVQGDEADLVKDVEVVKMALVEDKLKKKGRGVHID